MAALIRELLVDAASGKLDPVTRLDLKLGLDRLLEKGVITQEYIRRAGMFARGFTLSELPWPEEESEQMLVTLWCSLEQETGYTDEIWLHGALRVYPQYENQKLYLRKKLIQYERGFE